MRKFDPSAFKFCVIDSEGNYYQFTETKKEAENIIRRGLYRHGYDGHSPILTGLPEDCCVVPFFIDADSRPTKSDRWVEVLRCGKWVEAYCVESMAHGIIADVDDDYRKFYSWNEVRLSNG